MKKKICSLVIGLWLVSLLGISAVYAQPHSRNQEQDRPPKNGQQPDCKPTKDHPCPPPGNNGNGHHKRQPDKEQRQPECRPTKDHPCPPANGNNPNDSNGQNNRNDRQNPPQEQPPQR